MKAPDTRRRHSPRYVHRPFRNGQTDRRSARLPPLADMQFDIGADDDADPLAYRTVRPARRHLSVSIRPRAAPKCGSSTTPTMSSACWCRITQLHQGTRARPRQDPARQRHHDQRRRPVETPALHDAACVPPPRHHRILAAHRRVQRALHREMGSAGGARRARQCHRRHERAHARDRAAVDIRHRPRALEKEFGSNPFDIVTKETARDLKFAYRFRQLAKLVGALAQRRREETDRTLRFPADAHGCARQGNRRAHVRARADRRGHDADRRRSRDHGQRTQLDLVPAVAEPARPKARLHAEIDAAPETPSPASRTWNRSRTPATWSTKRCGCIRRGGCCRAGTIGPDTLVRLRVPAGHRRAARALSTAPPSALLEGARRVPSRALRRGARNRTSAFRLHAVCRGPAPLHR